MSFAGFFGTLWLRIQALGLDEWEITQLDWLLGVKYSLGNSAHTTIPCKVHCEFEGARGIFWLVGMYTLINRRTTYFSIAMSRSCVVCVGVRTLQNYGTRYRGLLDAPLADSDSIG